MTCTSCVCWHGTTRADSSRADGWMHTLRGQVIYDLAPPFLHFLLAIGHPTTRGKTLLSIAEKHLADLQQYLGNADFSTPMQAITSCCCKQDHFRGPSAGLCDQKVQHIASSALQQAECARTSPAHDSSRSALCMGCCSALMHGAAMPTQLTACLGDREKHREMASFHAHLLQHGSIALHQQSCASDVWNS